MSARFGTAARSSGMMVGLRWGRSTLLIGRLLPLRHRFPSPAFATFHSQDAPVNRALLMRRAPARPSPEASHFTHVGGPRNRVVRPSIRV